MGKFRQRQGLSVWVLHFVEWRKLIQLIVHTRRIKSQMLNFVQGQLLPASTKYIHQLHACSFFFQSTMMWTGTLKCAYDFCAISAHHKHFSISEWLRNVSTDRRVSKIKTCRNDSPTRNSYLWLIPFAVPTLWNMTLWDGKSVHIKLEHCTPFTLLRI